MVKEKRKEKNVSEFQEKVIAINRVSKTVKGGRIFKFAAVVVVGNKKGKVGVGIGKSGEISDAVRKGIDNAKKNVIRISLRKTTIPHEIVGSFGAGKVLLKPAPEGTGLIAGGAVRAVVEMSGIRDVRTKSLRSKNAINVARAALDGLSRLRSLKEVAMMREVDPGEILWFFKFWILKMEKKMKVKLIKSVIGAKKSQKRIVESLGLSRIGSVKEQPDNAATKGKIEKISHLVEIV